MTPLEVLQSTLSGEHAAVYVYSVLAAQTSQSTQPTLFARLDSAYKAHRAQRDRLTVLVSHVGGEPVAAAVAYDLPNDASTPALVAAAARTTEQRLLNGYGELVENTLGAERAFALTALQQSALRVVSLGARPSDYPGMTDPPV